MLLAIVTTATAWAGRGAVELSLDRGAVAGLIELSLPEPLLLSLPGSNELTLSVGSPRELLFRDGGVEVLLPLQVEELELAIGLHVRYEPALEPLSGIVRLVPESAEPESGIPFRFDFSRWLGPVDLPRRLDWALELKPGHSVDLTCFVQGLTVGEDRLEVALSLVTVD